MRICDVEGCQNKHEAKGFCKKHYIRYRKYGDPLAEILRKPKIPYDENHQIIDNIEHKRCSVCCEWFSMDENNFYINKANSVDGFHPYCKVCTKKKSTKWIKENPEKYKPHYEKRNKKEYFKEKMKVAAKKQRENGYYEDYRKNNKDKFIEYNKKRKENKTHDITDYEWFECLDYFNNSCAYCGLSELEHMRKHNTLLHKDHVIHDGSNYIENNVPSCKNCNSQKTDSDFNYWYNESNIIFSIDRLNRIISWTTKDFMKLYI